MPEFVRWIWAKIGKGQKGSLPNGILYLKGGDLAEELAQTGMRWHIDHNSHPGRSAPSAIRIYILGV